MTISELATAIDKISVRIGDVDVVVYVDNKPIKIEYACEAITNNGMVCALYDKKPENNE